jgi:molybdenum cofactor biosynthesis enzyme MoaA
LPETELIKFQEAQTPIELSVDTTLRAKISDACGLSCTFCHNEGTPVAATKQYLSNPTVGSRVSIYVGTNNVDFMPGMMRPDDAYQAALLACKDTLELDELHLTGGEPTLNPNVSSLASMASELGYMVKLTSNGETGSKPIGQLAAAGVVKINFSVFGTTAEELAEVQHDRFSDKDFAQQKIDALESAVAACVDVGIEANMNLVVRGVGDLDRVNRLIEAYGDATSIRLLNDLDSRGSTEAIYQYLASQGATPRVRKLTAGSSNTRTLFDMDGVDKPIQFKQIRKTRLPGTCDGCQFDAECHEGFYGVRLYVDKVGQYLLGVCLRRMDYTIGISDFLKSGRPQAIKDYKTSDQEELVRAYGSYIVE